MDNIKKIDDNSQKGNILKIFKGSILAIIITLVLLLITAIVLTYSNIPEKIVPLTIIIIASISILIGSIISTNNIKKMGLLNGALVGAIYMVTIYLLSSILVTGFSFNIKSILMLIFAIIAGMLGGIIGVNIYKK